MSEESPRWWRVEVEPRIQRIAELEAELAAARTDSAILTDALKKEIAKAKGLEDELAGASVCYCEQFEDKIRALESQVKLLSQERIKAELDWRDARARAEKAEAEVERLNGSGLLCPPGYTCYWRKQCVLGLQGGGRESGNEEHGGSPAGNTDLSRVKVTRGSLSASAARIAAANLAARKERDG